MLIDDVPTEKVHLFACKRFLHVAARAPNTLVYGELGRHPLRINCFIAVLVSLTSHGWKSRIKLTERLLQWTEMVSITG